MPEVGHTLVAGKHPIGLVGASGNSCSVMKCSVFLVSLIATSAIAATAPDSIAGKVYRDTTVIASLRGGSERTILFGTDGRFVLLKFASANFLSLQLQSSFVLEAPRGDGAYVYR